MLEQIHALLLQYSVATNSPERPLPSREPSALYDSGANLVARREDMEIDVRARRKVLFKLDNLPDSYDGAVYRHNSGSRAPLQSYSGNVRFDRRGHSRMPDFTSAFMRGVV